MLLLYKFFSAWLILFHVPLQTISHYPWDLSPTPTLYTWCIVNWRLQSDSLGHYILIPLSSSMVKVSSWLTTKGRGTWSMLYCCFVGNLPNKGSLPLYTSSSRGGRKSTRNLYIKVSNSVIHSSVVFSFPHLCSQNLLCFLLINLLIPPNDALKDLDSHLSGFYIFITLILIHDNDTFLPFFLCSTNCLYRSTSISWNGELEIPFFLDLPPLFFGIPSKSIRHDLYTADYDQLIIILKSFLVPLRSSSPALFLVLHHHMKQW